MNPAYRPMLATLVNEPFDDKQWVFETNGRWLVRAEVKSPTMQASRGTGKGMYGFLGCTDFRR
jgi:hypothetical protein